MANTSYDDLLPQVKSFFSPGDINDPRVNPDLRRRIAYEMMRKQRRAPQNIGEGINAVGEAIGDVRQEGRLAAADIAGAENRRAATEGVLGAGGATPAVAGLTAPAAGPVTSEAVPPIVVADTQQDTPPPPVVPAGRPSPLPPESTGAMPPPPMPVPPGTVPSNTIAPPPGALAHTGGRGPIDPRARAALILAARQQAAGGPPPGPTAAGGQPPAVGGDPRLNANAQMAALPPTTPPVTDQGIRTAPRVPSTMIRPEMAGVPQRVSDPAPPPLVPLTPVQRAAMAKAREFPNDPEMQQIMKQIIDQEEIKRSHAQGILNKQYEIQAKRADPQYQATLAKTEAEARRALEPDLRKREDVEEGTYYDPSTGTYKQARVEGGTDTAARPTFKPASEFQGKTFVNYGRTRLAHENLTEADEQIIAKSPGQAAMGAVGLGSWQNDQYKKAVNNNENFVQAFIRQQSGAGYGVVEAEAEARSMTPRYKDSPDVLRQKREQRAQFLAGLDSIIGPRGVKAAEWAMNREQAPQLAKQKAINEQMADVVPKRVGEVREMKDTAGRVVARREWDGKNWREL